MIKVIPPEPPQKLLSLGHFRAITKDLPDETMLVPRYLNPPSDSEPGVSLDVLGTETEDGTTVVALCVSLFYLNDLDDDAGEDEDDLLYEPEH